MQKDILSSSKGETSQQKFDNQTFTTQPPSVGETVGHKMKEVGHDVNATLKENVGVGVGNYPSYEDRLKSGYHGEKYEEKKGDLQQTIEEKKEQVKGVTEPIGHKVQEIAHNVNATLKQNVGIGVGNYSSEVDQKLSQEHRQQYDEKMQGVNEKIENVKQNVQAKKEEITSNLIEKKEQLKEKAHEGSMGLYTHRLEEVGHSINAKLKETVGIGIGDYPSEVDRQKAEEHWEEYQEKVKEGAKVEVSESNPIVHKIKEVAHTVNANLKEIIGVGVGNYSSEVDRELSELHHQKYEEKVHTNENLTETESIDFGKTKEKLGEKLFGDRESEPTKEAEVKKFDEPPKKDEFKRFDESEFPKL